MAKKYLTVKKLRHLKYIYISKNKRQSILDMDPSFYEKFMYVMHWFIFAVDRLGLRRHQKIYYYKSWKITPNNTAVLQVSTYVVVGRYTYYYFHKNECKYMVFAWLH